MIHVVNMIPASLSGESHQDSEPNLAVNPANPSQMVATAFTPAPMGGANAPIYVSTDGGATWSLRTVVPGDDGFVGTHDITVGFPTSSGVLYAGILNGTTGDMQILRTPTPTSITPMTVLVDRSGEDQPWTVAASVAVGSATEDRVFIGNEDGNQPLGRTATVDVSQDAATAPPPAGFAPVQLERRPTVVIPILGRGKDGPPIRTAYHPSGVVYSAFQRWAAGNFPQLDTDIVVCRDDNWGAGGFAALVDAGDGLAGQRVATNRFVLFNAIMGQERLGSDLSIAVDPTDPKTVWIAWCDRVGGPAGTDWTLHVSRSTDSGQTWSGDLRTITNVKNPSLAVNRNRLLGLVYQQYTGTTWDTKLELTPDAWAAPVAPLVLHTAPANTPARQFLPYIGDYIRLLAVGADFYGVFCGNNTPNIANFPNGVTYQRAADWTTHRLLSTDGVTVVPPSIDPFFFHWSERIIPPGPIRGPITPHPVVPRPPRPGPIIPRPPRPPQPPEPPAPIGPVPGPPETAEAKATELEL